MMSFFEVGSPISNQKLQEYLPILEETVKGKIPNSLIQIWKQHNGFRGNDRDEDIDIEESVYFYSIEECLERNRDYTHICIPGYIIIADDDGGTSVAVIKLGEESEDIFISERGILRPMRVEYLENTGFTLDEWHQLGCYMCFGYEPVELNLGEAIVLLEKIPLDGLKGLNKIKKILQKNDWSKQKLLEIKSSIPYVLAIEKYQVANAIAFKINRDEQCTSLWKISEYTCEEIPIRDPLSF